MFFHLYAQFFFLYLMINPGVAKLWKDLLPMCLLGSETRKLLTCPLIEHSGNDNRNDFSFFIN